MLARLWKKLFSHRNQSWTFYAQLTRMASGMLFILIVVRVLEVQALATWYQFVAAFGITTLAEMGLRQVYSRHIAQSNVTRIKEGPAELSELLANGHGLYVFIAGLIAVLALCGGSWWLFGGGSGGLGYDAVLAWMIYVAGGVLMVYSIYYNAVLGGIGELWQTQKVAIVCSWLTIITLLLLSPLLHGSLYLPVLAYFLTQLVSLFLSRRLMRTSLQAIQVAVRLNWRLEGKVARMLRKDLSAMFLIMVGYQLLTNGFILLIARFSAPTIVAAYGLTMQLVNVVLMLSSSWGVAAFYDFAALHKANRVRELRSAFFVTLTKTGVISAIGLLGILAAGGPLLQLIHAKTGLLPIGQLALLLGLGWFEFMLGQFAQLLFAKGDMRVAYYSVAGTAGLFLVCYLLLSNGWGLSAVLIARAICYFAFSAVPCLLMTRPILMPAFASNPIGERA